MRRETATKQWLLVLLAVLATCAAASTKTKMSPDPQEARADYIARVQQQMGTSQPAATLGSLWNPGAVYAEMGSDYKARNINDIVEIQVVEQTTASSTGDVDAERSFAASSGITALPGKLKVGGVSNLFGANSSSALKGTGSADTGSTLTTTLSARIIAVLPNSNMVVEAQREVFMNNQHETMIVRGVLRPGDVSSLNVASSAALADLEIELKGKGVVSDATRRPNPAIRAILWLVGF
jgi:flagellar L-ring protein precursor FlgH